MAALPALPEDRLDSWKEIAAYLNRGVRTVRRWEQEEGMPVHRQVHRVQGSVYAYRSEIDAWRKRGERRAAPGPVKAIAVLRFANLSDDPENAYFADGLADEVTADLSPITSDQYKLPAKRPPYSVLSNAKLAAVGVAAPRPWQEALAAYLEERKDRRP